MGWAELSAVSRQTRPGLTRTVPAALGVAQHIFKRNIQYVTYSTHPRYRGQKLTRLKTE